MESTGGYERAIYEQVETLFKENYQLIFKAAFRVTGSPESAEDVLQTVFVRLLQEKRPPKDFLKNPAGYLHRAATNEAISMTRSRDRQKLTDEEIDFDQMPAPGSDSTEGPDIERLRAAMAKMKPGSVELLNLYYNDGYTCREIAEMQGRLTPAVGMDLSRARSELKRLVRIEEKHSEEKRDQRNRKQTLAGASEA
jgi:RNA polymerase sigma-70 factor (ECF subfamily)